MSTQVIDPETIKANVRDYYGAAIQKGSCCGGGPASDCCDSREASLYGADALGQLPADVNTTSFGCGNPIALASLKPGEVVLDLGSGGGLDVLLAAQRVGPSGFVYGLDMTDAMLEQARRNAAKAGATNVDFLKGDIEAIPLPDASVDVIISNCVINLAPDKGQVFQEARRILRPGGRLAVSDIVIDGDLGGLPVSEAQIRAALSWTGCIAGALTIDQYRALLAEAGFTAIDIAVQHRYGVGDLVQNVPADLAHLAPEVIADLVGRFVSSSIAAMTPAE